MTTISPYSAPTRPHPGVFDFALVGGGLQNALIYLLLDSYQPDCKIALFEQSNSLGGNHTWCFHEMDVPDSVVSVVEPLVENRWPAYEVTFPSLRRTIHSEYCCISSRRLASVVSERAARRRQDGIFLGTEVKIAKHDHVVLSNDSRVYAKLVVDARGPRAPNGASCAYQKFYGAELQLAQSSDLLLPVLMDANVPQTDGFRFFYLLPLARDRVLVEDTYFSDSPHLPLTHLRTEVQSYAASRGFRVTRVVREEQGVLPLPKRTPKLGQSWGPLKAGYGGGWLHPTTGYSFPAALRLGLHIATHQPEAIWGTDFDRLVRSHVRQVRFCVLLNRMLFDLFPPGERRHVMERFYTLPEDLIARFYSLQSSAADRARILCGRPPRGLSLRRALMSGATA